jgi:putative ABC transport system substrate-binding protein
MRRRDFIIVLGGVSVGFPIAARAQQASTVHRIGLLRVGTPPRSFIDPLRQGLSALGYVEDRNLVIEYGIARRVDQLPDMAAELVSRNVDVIVASGTPAVIPARNATHIIPIVMVAGIDPIATGLATNLARPTGNVTGLTALFADLTGKRMELIKEILPTISKVGLMSPPANPGHDQYVREAEVAAQKLGVALQVLPVTGPEDFEATFRKAAGAGAIIHVDDAMLTFRRERLVELAIRHRIPGVYGPREFVEQGGFIALGPRYADLYRRAATYVDKILKGAKPSDLPIEQPTKFELIINLKTAKALGLTVPESFLVRADEVIE